MTRSASIDDTRKDDKRKDDNPDRARARLRWRCRRGMRELDALLEGWLEHRWADADSERRACFEELLETEDDRLWAWLTGRERPASARLAALIDELAGPGRV